MEIFKKRMMIHKCCLLISVFLFKSLDALQSTYIKQYNQNIVKLSDHLFKMPVFNTYEY